MAGMTTVVRRVNFRPWKLSRTYYSPRGYWKGLTAIKKLAAAAKVSEDVAKDWLKKKTSGRSTCLLHGTYRDLSLMLVCQTRSIKLTSFSFHRTAWVGERISMLSRSLTSPTATRRLSLWLARAQQRSPMPCLASTNGGLWSSPSFFRLTLDVNLWVL